MAIRWAVAFSFRTIVMFLLSAKSVMQQTLFSGDAAAQADPVMQALQGAEERWRSTATVAMGIAGAALVSALVALGVVALAYVGVGGPALVSRDHRRAGHLLAREPGLDLHRRREHEAPLSRV